MKLSSLSYGNPKKIGRENRKANELGFQEMAAILSPHGLYGGNRKSKVPLLNNEGYKPLKRGCGSLQISPSDGCPAAAPCLASTQAMRSRCVSSASNIPDCVVAHRSDRCSSPVRPVPTGQTGQTNWLDRSGAAAAPSSVLRSWLCGSTKEPSSFLVNHQKPRELSVASANRHS
jgi:hypothetical protein